ncbi:hypothetical protein GEV33_001397 [Tenebrio molitor]|uniref:G-protein coupled receptors family 1 profile domain-containing protein n=1 Tax=Tenebrio molitor TaxID=7067 RepID=A0A8J6LG44_TENMO|nr:hypothetical protein GEV33_001397 [Tenebrio molitor]
MIYVTTIPQVVEIDTVLLTQCAPTWSMETDTIFVILKMVMFYLIPLLFMSVAYLQIIRVLWKSGDVPHQMMVCPKFCARNSTIFFVIHNSLNEDSKDSMEQKAWAGSTKMCTISSKWVSSVRHDTRKLSILTTMVKMLLLFIKCPSWAGVLSIPTLSNIVAPKHQKTDQYFRDPECLRRFACIPGQLELDSRG